jgi:hypothetical protein
VQPVAVPACRVACVWLPRRRRRLHCYRRRRDAVSPQRRPAGRTLSRRLLLRCTGHDCDAAALRVCDAPCGVSGEQGANLAVVRRLEKLVRSDADIRKVCVRASTTRRGFLLRGSPRATPPQPRCAPRAVSISSVDAISVCLSVLLCPRCAVCFCDSCGRPAVRCCVHCGGVLSLFPSPPLLLLVLLPVADASSRWLAWRPQISLPRCDITNVGTILQSLSAFRNLRCASITVASMVNVCGAVIHPTCRCVAVTASPAASWT